MSETGMTIGEASKILLRMKFRVGTDDLNTTIRMCEENEAIDVVLKYCFDLASMCNENCPQIVRCKDCMYGIASSKEYVFCSKATYFSKYKEPDWFCADGRRKTEL